MTPLEHIRKSIFDLSQQEFSKEIGVNQSTVSRWERNESEPTRTEMEAIRDLAVARKIAWDDRWFFETPVTAPKGEAA